MMHGESRWRAPTLGLFLAVGTACSTQSEPARSSVASSNCASENAVWQASGMLSCPRSVDAYCAAADECPPNDWSTVLSDADAGCWPGLLGTCGTERVVEANWGCGGNNSGPAQSSLIFVYGDDGGKLVAAVQVASLSDASTDRSQTCLGGPPTIDVVTSCGDWSSCAPIRVGSGDR